MKINEKEAGEWPIFFKNVTKNISFLSFVQLRPFHRRERDLLQQPADAAENLQLGSEQAEQKHLPGTNLVGLPRHIP